MKYTKPKYYLICLCVFLSFSLENCVNHPEQNEPPKASSTPAIPENPVQEIAKKATVLITGVRGGSGSGVIILSNEKYYVLTAKHVVGTAPGSQNQYDIKSYDGKVYLTINAENYDQLVVNTSEDIDLALIELPIQGEKNYTAAKLSRGLSENIPVLVSGWQKCLPQPQYDLTNGKIVKKLSSKSDIDKLSDKDDQLYLQHKDTNYNNGYKVKYTNATLSGMSGGPVFNQDGKIVAIHGMPGAGGKENTDQDCQPINNPNLANNWGIPISSFFESNLAKDKKIEE